jgi:serine/threonine protein kinase
MSSSSRSSSSSRNNKNGSENRAVPATLGDWATYKKYYEATSPGIIKQFCDFATSYAGCKLKNAPGTKKYVGKGAFGYVYRVWFEGSPPLVVKEINYKTASDKRDIYNEAKVLQDLSRHAPGIFPEFHALGFDDAAQKGVIVMECIEGEELLEYVIRMKKGNFMLHRDLMTSLRSLVGQLHTAGYVHLDIKPQNIMIHITPTDQLILRLIDAGSVRPIGIPYTNNLTKTPLFSLSKTRKHTPEHPNVVFLTKKLNAKYPEGHKVDPLYNEFAIRQIAQGIAREFRGGTRKKKRHLRRI